MIFSSENGNQNTTAISTDDEDEMSIGDTMLRNNINKQNFSRKMISNLTILRNYCHYGPKEHVANQKGEAGEEPEEEPEEAECLKVLGMEGDVALKCQRKTTKSVGTT